ncbi:hypothetical protein ZIOFF_053274 [Zingiber officinale]|uniref:Uncharacterized protein n=1 Tax=Zingiber officinale TaxID=94328 RepID=A0A8J5FC54_ZINOF|nr:hypothetical protein ZIOFF_053274 [Zingiber officinale]
MKRSSRHRSHRSRKLSRDRSDSEEDEESLREKRTREEETSGGRVSRDLMSEKQRSLHEHSGKEMVSNSNGDVSGEKKRKTREDEEAVVADRWNGGKENDGKRSKSEDFGPTELDKSSKAKTDDIKSRSSRRNDGHNERNEDHGSRNDFAKGKSEKDSIQREGSYHYKDGKERFNSKDREVQDSRHEKSEDLHSRKYGSKTLSNNEEHAMKKNAKINVTESQVQDLLPRVETEKGPEKHTRRDDTEDKEKRLEDSRDTDGRRLSSRDHSRSRSHKDERHESTKYKGRYRNDYDHHDDKNQEERPSKDRSSDKSDRFNLRDENKSLDGYKKTKPQDTNQDDTYLDARDTKLKESKRRRYSNEKDDLGDPKLRGTKERHEIEKNVSSVSRTTSSYNDKPRSGYRTEKTDSSPNNKQFKGFTSSNSHSVNDHYRDMSRYEDSGHRLLAPEERRSNPSLKGDSMTPGLRDRNTAPRSGKLSTKDDIHSGELLVETSLKYDRAPRSDECSSPNQSKARSSTKNSHRISESKYERAYRQSLDTEIIQRNASYKDGDRGEFDSEKPIPDDIPKAGVNARESTPIGSAPVYRSSNVSDRSPNYLRPPPSSRVGIDSPSVLGPYQEDNKAHSNDRRSNSRYKRSELGFERGHGNAWTVGPNWSAPATNVFMPLQHGPPSTGFHPAMSHFPPPPMYGVRPMDLAHGGVSYHIHDMAERFSSHGRPFGWHNSVDQLCHPQMQMWDRSNGMFSNESHIYGRQEWDDNGQLMGSRGWEMGYEMWKDHNVNSMDPALKKEMQSSTHSLTDELVQSKCLPTESSGGKHSSDTATSKNDMESPPKTVSKRTFEPSHVVENKKVNYVPNYLSRIDISPDLARLELYEMCTSQVVKSDSKDVCCYTNSGCFQMNKDGKIGKIDTSSILKSFYSTAKDDLFKPVLVMSSPVLWAVTAGCAGTVLRVYVTQAQPDDTSNPAFESGAKAMSLYHKQSTRYVKLAAPEKGCSEETKRLVLESSENEVAQDGGDSASLVKLPIFADDPTDNMQVENAIVQESDNLVSDSVRSAVAHDAGESMVSLSRILNSDENTH